MAAGRMTDEEQVRCFQIQDELVASRTMEEATAEQYAALCIARSRAYEAKIASMTLPLYLTVWAKEMETKSGKRIIKIHHNYLPWVAAFLVSRYGEAVDAWPETVSEQDLKRAREWKNKSLPAVVTV